MNCLINLWQENYIFYEKEHAGGMRLEQIWSSLSTRITSSMAMQYYWEVKTHLCLSPVICHVKEYMSPTQRSVMSGQMLASDRNGVSASTQPHKYMYACTFIYIYIYLFI